MLIAFLILCASAVLFGTVGLCFSAWVRSTIGAATLAYGAMLIPVVALPIVAATVASSIGVILSGNNGPSPTVAGFLYYVGGIVLSFNPFIAGALTELIISENRSLFFFTLSSPFGAGSGTVIAVGPWLIYLVLATLASILFFLLALYLARPTRIGGGRRRGKAPQGA